MEGAQPQEGHVCRGPDLGIGFYLITEVALCVRVAVLKVKSRNPQGFPEPPPYAHCNTKISFSFFIVLFS